MGGIILKRKRLLLTSIAINILFIIILGYFVIQKGGVPYLIGKTSSVFGIESKEEFESANPEYLTKKSIFELLPINEESTVFVGDSITAGIEWSELFGSLDYVNRGIHGDNSEGVLTRLDEIVESKPKRIFIMVGVNDLHSNGGNAQLLKNYNQILEKIKNDSPGTNIYVQSILPYNVEMYKNSTKMSNEIIRETNIELIKLAEEHNATFIDLYSLISVGDELNPDYTFDGIHLSGKAYLVWKDALELYLD